MHYMGGKHRQSKDIVRVLKERHGSGFKYCEPFCGSMSSSVRVMKELNPSHTRLSDINKPLMKLWAGLVSGSIKLPRFITDEEYDRHKMIRDMEDPMTAWFGVAVSFGGKWFGGLARHSRGKLDHYDFAPQVNSTMKKVEVLRRFDPDLRELDYHEATKNLRGWVVYLDPPYAGRTKAHCFESFDTELFWDRVRKLSVNNDVYVSAFDHPDDFDVVHNWGNTIVGHHAAKPKDSTSEKLVTWNKLKSKSPRR